MASPKKFSGILLMLLLRLLIRVVRRFRRCFSGLIVKSSYSKKLLVNLSSISFTIFCWATESNKGVEFLDFKKLKYKFLAKDKSGKLVFLADSSFTLEMTKQKYPSLKFHNKSEF